MWDHKLRDFVNQCLSIPVGTRRFVGGLPVSVTRHDVEWLRRSVTSGGTFHEYAVSFKADGHRKFLGATTLSDGKRVAFLQDRLGNFEVLEDLPLHDWAYRGTLFDVEQLANKSLLVFDCATIHGNTCRTDFYPLRLELAREWLSSLGGDVVARRERSMDYEYASRYPDVTVRCGGWNLKVKAVFYASALRRLPEKWIYPDDGFIWTSCSNAFHTIATHSKAEPPVLKWKPPDKITVDFLVRCADETPPLLVEPGFQVQGGAYSLHTLVGSVTRYFTGIYLLGAEEPLEIESVYEFNWDGQTWVPVRLRRDKEFPNSLDVVQRTVANIRESMTRAELVAS